MALGELERAVMGQLWDADAPLTVREVHDQLDRELAYTTVMTVLGRLARKGIVRQERDGKAYRYAPASTREQMTAALMLDALGDVGGVGGDRTAALVAFVDQVGPDGAAALRAALDGSAAPRSRPGQPTSARSGFGGPVSNGTGSAGVASASTPSTGTASTSAPSTNAPSTSAPSVNGTGPSVPEPRRSSFPADPADRPES